MPRRPKDRTRPRPRSIGYWALGAQLGLGVACGRIGFDKSSESRNGDGGSTDQDAANPIAGPSNLSYAPIRPVYILGNAIEELTPTVSGSPMAYAIEPSLPAGIVLDQTTGVIRGTPSAVQALTLHMVTASNEFGSTSTPLRLQTAAGFVANDGGDLADALVGDGLCETAPGNAQCTLRAALTEVNAGNVPPQSALYIQVPTVTLSARLPDLTESISIFGASAQKTTIDLAGVGPLTEFAANDVSLSLSNLTYANGVGSISHNFRQGLSFDANLLKVTGCNGFLSLAGANRALQILDAEFTQNTGDLIQLSGSGTGVIERSTFADNTANVAGLVFLGSGALTVLNSTFTNNTGASGAVFTNNGTVTIVHSTIAGNSATGSAQAGGIESNSGGDCLLANNIIFDNTGPLKQCDLCTSNGGNLVSPSDGQCGSHPSDAGGADPLLQPLADNGGATRTRSLGTSSPAIGAALLSECVAADQRGVARREGAPCDSGAYEEP